MSARGDNVTELVRAMALGDDAAEAALVPLVYDELHRIAARRLAGERARHTLSPTELVHEAWLRIANGAGLRAEDRNHFFALFARTARRVLVDHARARGAQKRGALAGAHEEALTVMHDGPQLEMLALDAAVERLRGESPRQARVVELRFFGGLSIEETSHVLATSPATVKRDWEFARAWLYRELAGS